MAFMIPQYRNDSFLACTDERDETTFAPAADCTESNWPTVVVAEPGWYCRLSAPGYLDCTEWSGPFPTLEEARKNIADIYEVCPECGSDDIYSGDADTGAHDECAECGTVIL